MISPHQWHVYIEKMGSWSDTWREESGLWPPFNAIIGAWFLVKLDHAKHIAQGTAFVWSNCIWVPNL